MLVTAAGCGGEGSSGSADPGQTSNGDISTRDPRSDCLFNSALISGYALQYKQEKGAYPLSIEEMVPEFLQKMPVCPAGGTYRLITGEGLSDVECSVHGVNSYQ